MPDPGPQTPGRPGGDQPPPPRPRAAIDRPRHPTAQAAVLLVAVTLVIVGLAALSAWGLL